MKQFLFTVYDAAAGMYLNPFCAPSIAMAVRGFREVVNQSGHQFAKFPEDYTLFLCGEFATDTGELSPVKLQSMGVALEFVEHHDGPGGIDT